MSSNKESGNEENQKSDNEGSGISWLAAAGIGAVIGGGLAYMLSERTTEQPTCNQAASTNSNSIIRNSEAFLNRLLTTEECSICKENMLLVVKLPCGHRFHDSCAKEWIQKNGTCPTCRSPTKLIEMKYSV